MYVTFSSTDFCQNTEHKTPWYQVWIPDPRFIFNVWLDLQERRQKLKNVSSSYKFEKIQFGWPIKWLRDQRKKIAKNALSFLPRCPRDVLRIDENWQDALFWARIWFFEWSITSLHVHYKELWNHAHWHSSATATRLWSRPHRWCSI